MDNETGTLRVKTGLAEMLKGGVIMDVTTAEQAKIAEDAGAVAVMALERVPADIRRDGGVARMADPTKVTDKSFNAAFTRIKKAVQSKQIRQFTGNDYAPPLAKGDLSAAMSWLKSPSGPATRPSRVIAAL